MASVIGYLRHHRSACVVANLWCTCLQELVRLPLDVASRLLMETGGTGAAAVPAACSIVSTCEAAITNDIALPPTTVPVLLQLVAQHSLAAGVSLAVL